MTYINEHLSTELCCLIELHANLHCGIHCICSRLDSQYCLVTLVQFLDHLSKLCIDLRVRPSFRIHAGRDSFRQYKAVLLVSKPWYPNIINGALE